MANWSRPTPMWQNNACHAGVHHFFSLRLLAIRSQAFEKNASVHPFDLTIGKKNYICSAVQLKRSKKICIRSAIQPIHFERLV